MPLVRPAVSPGSADSVAHSVDARHRSRSRNLPVAKAENCQVKKLARRHAPLPRSAVPHLSAACLVVLASTEVLAWSGAPRLWCLALALIGLTLLILAQLALLGSHLGAHMRSPVLDVACATAAHSAVAVAFFSTTVQARTGTSAVVASLALIAVTASATAGSIGIPWLAITRLQRDIRVMWLSIAAMCTGSLVLLWLARTASILDIHDAVITASQPLLVGVLVTSLGAAVVSRPPAILTHLPARPRAEALCCLIAGAECVVVLMVAHRWVLPDVAVIAAGAGLLAAMTKLAVLVKELGVLQASYHAVLVDEATLLPNRSAVQQRILQLKAAIPAAAEGSARESRTQGTLVLLGLTQFKDVNDVLGREGGDTMLLELAGRLADAQKPGEMLARYGGDEFAVLLPHGDALAARERAQELLALLLAPVSIGTRALHPRPRAGIAVLRPASAGGGGLDVMRRAEAALDAAKKCSAGVVCHQDSLHAAARRRVETGEALHMALEAEQFVLHYQPQLDREGRVHGVEALLRWQHLPAQLLPPDQFLPLVEELGLQREVSRWVLATAVRQAAAWGEAGRTLAVSVNLSADDVMPELVDIVAGELSRTGLPADQLVIELTETTLVEDPDRVAAVLHALVKLGVRVSIDDYGTGYSSLMLLLRLPVTELKIDKSFITNVLTDARSQIVVRATLQLAHQLQMRVVAEGVEDTATTAFLRSAGCDLTQGWAHLPAVAADDLMLWLAQHDEALSESHIP